MNPILPIQHFVPDVEARQWADGRIYLYGSTDISGYNSFCSWQYRVFSSDNLQDWVDHGESFRAALPNKSADWLDAVLFAPDCVWVNGRYHLFFCGISEQGVRLGVAESGSPTGPFTNAVPIAGADQTAIDPTALVDDDGQVYLYWGQRHLRGARLRPDLQSIDPETLETHLLNEEADGFFEGASIRKRNGIYYLLYADNSRHKKPTSLAYATSSKPLGPFTKRGILIDNIGCDPGVGNNHGSIAEFNGQWYVFYHRSSQGNIFNRRVCVEPIAFHADGTIDEVEMTTQGMDDPLPTTEPIAAWRACLLQGRVCTAVSTPTPNAPTTHEYLTQLHRDDWAAYKYVDFDAQPGASFQARVGSLHGGLLEIHLDQPDGELLGVCKVTSTGGWQKWATVSCPIKTVSGVHAIYLVGKSSGQKFVISKYDPERLFDLERFWFAGYRK